MSLLDRRESEEGDDLFGLTNSLSREADRAERRRSRRASNPFQKNERAAPKPSLRVRKNQSWGINPEKPWLREKKSRNEVIGDRLVFAGMVVGFIAFCGFAVWGYFEGAHPPFCKLMDEDFRYSELDMSSWRHEVSSGGSNVGSFEWNTDSTDNSFVKDGKLHIRPTLTQAYPDGTAINLTETAGCLDPDVWCNMVQNSTAGTVINPVQSAKLTTRLNMTYGRVEVRAKMPKADWTWAAITLNPSKPVYGAFPAGGQITIAQVRGNSVSYKPGGRDRLDSFIVVGPDAFVGFAESYGSQQYLKFTDFGDGFHTFGLDWTRFGGIRTWLDDPTNTIMYINPFADKRGFWYQKRFDFDSFIKQIPGMFNPWAPGYPDLTAPFNVDFSLTLQVGVGGGFFNEGTPWSQNVGRQLAMSEFASNVQNYTSSWKGDEAMIVESVTMRKQCHVVPYTKLPKTGKPVTT